MKLPLCKLQQGITLLETLAIVVISSIILIGTTSILMKSSSEHSKQTSDTIQLAEVRYVLKQLTKDMRMSTKIEKGASNTFILSNEKSIVATYSFNETTHTITRNDAEIARNIQVFKIEMASQKIFITLKALNEKEITTELLFRSGT